MTAASNDRSLPAAVAGPGFTTSHVVVSTGPTRSSGIRGGIAAIFVTLLLANSLSAGEHAGQLTVDETVALTGVRYTTSSLWKFYARAHPDAREKLWKILDDNKRLSEHPAALRMMGHLGNGEDVVRIRKLVEGLKEEPYSALRRDAMRAVFDALGVMSQRELRGAREYVFEMADLGYWKDRQTLFSHPKNLEQDATLRLLPLVALAEGYCLSGRKDLEDLTKRISEQARDKADREYLQKYLSSERLRAFGEAVRKAQATQPSDEDRKLLLYLAHGEAPPKPPTRQPGTENATPGDGETVDADIKEAFSVYEKCQKAIEEGDWEYLALHLADNGKPIVKHQSPDRATIEDACAFLRREKADLDRTRERLSMMKDKQCTTGPATITYKDELSVRETARGQGGYGQIERNSSAVVTAVIEGSEAIVADGKPVNRMGVTLTPKGQFQVVFIRRFGRWHWNPFGW